MARPGNFTHLKPELEAAFKEGKQPRDLYGQYPQIPRSTIRDWHSALWRNSAIIPSDPENAHAVGVEVLPPRTNVVGLPPQEQSDISLARNTLRKICKDKEVNPAIRVHAAGYLMKLASLRHELPKHILEETEPTAEESLQKLEVEFINPDEAARTDALVG